MIAVWITGMGTSFLAHDWPCWVASLLAILPNGGVVHRGAADVVKLRRMTELPITEKSSGGSCGCGCGHDSLPELDARVIPHAIRHAAILGVVGSLNVGGAFILVAPHNPLPLLAQIADLHGDAIQVSYVQEGPDAWKLKLERRS